MEKLKPFSFTLNETPTIRRKICSDLDKIADYIEKTVPNSVVGLWSAFSYGKGRVKEIDGKYLKKAEKILEDYFCEERMGISKKREICTSC
ncbi:MAG: hypothetical protein H8D38_06130 [DPANN group archaeon]|nr:hypothetical protein [DPANN group archaeon]